MGELCDVKGRWEMTGAHVARDRRCFRMIDIDSLTLMMSECTVDYNEALGGDSFPQLIHKSTLHERNESINQTQVFC